MGARRVYACITALFFTAACAYIGAALFTALSRPRQSPVPAMEAGAALELWGILLRQEQCLSPALALELEAVQGQRIPAGEHARQSGVFYENSDGYEHLSPEDAENLTAQSLEALLQSKAKNAGGPKLIYGFEQYYAAFYSGEKKLSPGPCRIKFEGYDSSHRAEIISAEAGDNGFAVLIRLTGSEECLSLRLCRAEIIY